MAAVVALFHGAVPPPPPPSSYLNPPPKARNNGHFHSLQFHKHLSYRRTRREASSSSSSSWATDFDLYELLGIDRCSDQFEIKKAYRTLQKRCHPDIAGPAGHDMAILLNEIYSVLSDPIARGAYDQVGSMVSDVDSGLLSLTELSLVRKTRRSKQNSQSSKDTQGSLSTRRGLGRKTKSARSKPSPSNRRTAELELWGSGLIPRRESSTLSEPALSIASRKPFIRIANLLPFDNCIDPPCRFVERSNLAALEFLMSKQPRGSVRMSAGNAVGTRVSNIFAELTKFQNRYREMKEKASRNESKVHDLRRESRSWAIRGIRSIADWWYWRPPSAATVEAETSLALIPTRSTIPSTDRLQEAAARHKTKAIAGLKGKRPTGSEHGDGDYDDYYWTPITFLPPPSTTAPSTQEPLSGDVPGSEGEEVISAVGINKRSRSAEDLMGPVMMAVVSAAAVGYKGTEMVQMEGGGLKEHIAGSTALGVVNSFELQILLAGVTWFIIGMGVQSLVGAIGSKGVFRR
ncbi:hypothetical protein B296_00042833 [Ensete ventricosum]|uniref:J domain-containing protein n=1 Tax=Ensete ventricosum TaxID=4639 RepID=A0A426Y730_ENSVE|nr:hypothetical protein B296_00042833 [Ensete ventricosum]